MKPRSLALIVGLWLLQRPNEVSARRTEFRGEQERKRELQNLEPPKPAPFAKDVKSAAPKFKISKVKSKGCATRQDRRCDGQRNAL
jgi:hypothetical protein